jgi:hypothetical protein
MIDRRPGGTAAINLSGSDSSGCGELVHAPPVLDLLRGHLEPEFLLQRPGHRAAHRVRLMPTSA